MKSIRYIYFLIILTSIYVLFIDSGYLSDLRKDTPLSEWIIGEWIGIARYGDSYGPVLAKVDFVDREHLIFYLFRDPSGTESELIIPARYEFVSKNKIALRSRAQTEWSVERNDGLIINLGEPSSFRRIPRIERLTVILLGILIARTLYVKSPKRDDIWGERMNLSPTNDSNKRSVMSVTVALFLVCCVASILVYFIAPVNSFFFLTGMPWGAILIIEISLLLLVQGARILMPFYQGTQPIVSSLRSRLYFGAFLASGGICGALIGLYFWAFFFFIASAYMSGFYLF